MTIHDVFARLAKVGFIPDLADVNATYAYELEGVGTYRVIVRNGNIEVLQSPGKADGVVSAAPDDLMAVLTGRGNTITALMQGRIVFRGDIEHLVAQQSLFRAAMGARPEAEAAPAEVSP